jgi:hypothetical protein
MTRICAASIQPVLFTAQTPCELNIARLARHSRTLEDNWDDRIPTLMREAGFAEAAETGHLTKRIGRLTYYRAIRQQ